MSARPDPPDAPRRTPGGFPVVGIIGGGQLARMCRARPSSWGSAERARRGRRRAAPRSSCRSSPVGDHTDARGRAARSPATATWSPSTTSTCPPTCSTALEADGVALHPRAGGPAVRPGQARHARAARRDSASRARAGRGATVGGRGRPPSATTVGWPVVAKTPRGGYDGKGVRVVARRRRSSPTGSRGGRPDPLATGVLLEERVAVPPRARGARRAQPLGAGGRVAGRRDRADRRHLHRGARAGARARPGAGRRRHRTPALRIAGELGVTGVLAVELFEVRGRRRARTGVRRQRAGHAAAQQRPLVDGRRGHRPVRAAPAGRARPAARRPATARRRGR